MKLQWITSTCLFSMVPEPK